MRTFSVLFCLCASPLIAQAPAENVILVTLDGVRWQEVFGGLDVAVLDSTLKLTETREKNATYQRFSAPTAEERRAKLLPFLWGTLVPRLGSIAGNQWKKSEARITNRYGFSYPGYAEILTGRARDETIKSNDKVQSPAVTVLEFARDKLGLDRSAVASIASWDTMAWIAESKKGWITTNSGYAPFDHSDRQLRELSAQAPHTPTPWDGARHDYYTWALARKYLELHTPRLLHIAFDEPDDWAHDGRYDRVLDVIHRIDGYLKELWELLESLPAYRGRTALVITVDHGRGSSPKDWRDHGEKVADSRSIWIGCFGAGAARRGEWENTETVTQSQIAPTVAKLLGLDFRTAHPDAAPAIDAFIEKRTASVETSDWPQWRGADRAGEWRGVRLPARFTAETARVRWRVPLGGGYGGIAVSDGRLYVQDRSEKTSTERVLCVDPESGKLLWADEYAADYKGLDYPNGPRATPTVHERRVYTQGAVAHVRCLDAESGRVIWTIDTRADYRGEVPMWGHAASPLIYKDFVIVQIGGAEGGTLAALDRATGSIRWKALKEKAGYSSPTVFEHHGRSFLAFWSAESVAALAPDDGKVLWTVPYKSTYGVAIASPVVHDGLLLVSGYWEGSKCLALAADGMTPSVAWEGATHHGLMSTPLFRDGVLYALDKKEGLLGIEWKTGKVLWSDGHRVTAKDRNPHAAMVWAGGQTSDRAAILNAEGELILAALSRGGYAEHGRVKLLDRTWAHAAFAGQSVFARNDQELVAARIAADGELAE